jgi:hypothetical protein
VYTANPTAATSPRKMLPTLNVTSLTMGHLPGCLLTSVNVLGDHPFRQANNQGDSLPAPGPSCYTRGAVRLDYQGLTTKGAFHSGRQEHDRQDEGRRLMADPAGCR